MLGDVTLGDALDTLRDVDEVYVNAIKEKGLYDKIWQAFAVFLPVRSVGEFLLSFLEFLFLALCVCDGEAVVPAVMIP